MKISRQTLFNSLPPYIISTCNKLPEAGCLDYPRSSSPTTPNCLRFSGLQKRPSHHLSIGLNSNNEPTWKNETIPPSILQIVMSDCPYFGQIWLGFAKGTPTKIKTYKNIFKKIPQWWLSRESQAKSWTQHITSWSPVFFHFAVCRQEAEICMAGT